MKSGFIRWKLKSPSGQGGPIFFCFCRPLFVRTSNPFSFSLFDCEDFDEGSKNQFIEHCAGRLRENIIRPHPENTQKIGRFIYLFPCEMYKYLYPLALPQFHTHTHTQRSQQLCKMGGPNRCLQISRLYFDIHQPREGKRKPLVLFAERLDTLTQGNRNSPQRHRSPSGPQSSELQLLLPSRLRQRTDT